jgi:hypothetical protein
MNFSFDRTPRPLAARVTTSADTRREQTRKHRGTPVHAEKVANSRRSVVLLSGLLVLALGLPAAFAATGGFGETDEAPRAERGRSLVVNGGFENGTTGWRTARPSRLSTTAQAASGSSAARLSATRRDRVVLHDVSATVGSAPESRTYFLAAQVKAEGERVRGKLRLREYADGELVGSETTRFRATRSGWVRVAVSYVTLESGSAVDLSLMGRLGKRRSLLVDDVVMYSGWSPQRPDIGSPPSPVLPTLPDGSPDPIAPVDPVPVDSTDDPTSAPDPTNDPTPVPDATDSGGCVANAMGIPSSGAYLGAAVNGTSDIDEREARLGSSMALHRTYFSGSGIAAAVRTAKSDLARGRLPWISFKAPYSWSQMADGVGDDWARELADGLKTVPGPVWLAVHHEPENDGDMNEWTAMQARIAPIIHARTDNVAYSLIYSGWNTFGGGNNTIATKWPGDANVDILAIDAYNDYGAVRNGRVGTKVLDLKTYYVKMAAWAKEHGTAWAIGETGQTRAAAEIDPTWLDRAYLDMVALGGSGLSYYDSSANSVADWTLDDPIKFGRFKGLLPTSERVC